MPHPIDYLLMQPKYNQILVDSLPDIKRCQEWYLFDYNGNKILDLYAANTRTMLGHKPLSVGMLIKQRINQGLWPSLPVRAYRDFIARCKQLFPGYRYYCFAPSLRYVYDTLAQLSYYRNATWIDPAYPSDGLAQTTDQRQTTDINNNQSPAPLTRTRVIDTNDSGDHQGASNKVFFDTPNAKPQTPTVGIARIFCPITAVDILLPIIPHPNEDSPQIIATSDDAVYALFCNTTIPSGVTLAALLEMVKYFESRHHQHALRHANRADYIVPPLSTSDIPASIWMLHQHYLWPMLPEVQYHNMYRTMLAQNILIHPNPHAPSILPFRLPKKDYLRFLEITSSINEELC